MPDAEPRRHGPVLPGLLIAACLIAFVLLRDPSTTSTKLRQFVSDLRADDSTSYAFILEDPKGRPVGWDPCTPIDYVVNPQGAPRGWERTVDEAISVVEKASGFDFVSDGTTQNREFEQRVAPNVLIAWAGPEEVTDLAGNAAGIGGSTPLRSEGRTRFVSGVVVLDQGEYDVMVRTGRAKAMTLILAHELGHVLGLDHVEDESQLMTRKYTGQSGFGDGDRAGFRALHDLTCS